MGRQVIGKMRSVCIRGQAVQTGVRFSRAHSHALIVAFRDEEGVTGADRIDVKECHTEIILVDLRALRGQQETRPGRADLLRAVV